MSTLENERGSFPTRELSYFLYGGQSKLERKEYLTQIIENDPVFSLQNKHFESRQQQIVSAHRKCLRFHEITKIHHISPLSEDFFVLFNAINDHLPLLIHYHLFLSTLMSQSDEEQCKWWVEEATDLKILGCYAQTELSHGSNVKGLETTATFDFETDEFVIHSPTLGSTKFWIGALGVYATHAIVFAQLIIDGKGHGVHPLFMRIRDGQTHEPLKGIDVGDIGPKLGFAPQDNGFLRFDKVRLPRRNMLMKYSRVDRDGKYSNPPHSKLSYGGMIYMRVSFVDSASYWLSKAVTIGVRYAAQRRQFGKVGKETLILDYPLQQAKLLPFIAASFAFHFTGIYIREQYNLMQKDIDRGDFSLFSQFHATLSGLKSYLTNFTANGIEVIRKSCGGHGYSLSAGLSDIYTFYVHFTTAEGENSLMALQLSKYLSDCYDIVNSGKKLGGFLQYLSNIPLKCWQVDENTNFLHPQIYLDPIEHASARCINETFGSSHTQIELESVSHYHSRTVIVRSFFNSLTGKFKDVFSEQFCLFCMYLILNDSGHFTMDGFISNDQMKRLRLEYSNLLSKVRNNAVSLTDSFNHSDFSLNSVLGCYNGGYETKLMDWVRRNPVNNTSVFQSFSDYIHPLTKRSKL